VIELLSTKFRHETIKGMFVSLVARVNYKACPSESGTDKFMQRFI